MRLMTAGDRADRDGRGLLEHAVDAVADPHLLFLGLEVDVGGAALDGLLDHPVHELDDRRVLAADAELDRLVLAQVVVAGGGLLQWRAGGRLAELVLLVGGDRAVAEVGILEALEQLLDVGQRATAGRTS